METEPQRAPKASKKELPNYRKSIRNPLGTFLGGPRGVRGYTPGASEAPEMHIYQYAYLCTFMHILYIFMDIYAYICIFAEI